MSDRHKTKPYPLRMPEELRERLDAEAEINYRSLNAEIIARLQASFEDPARHTQYLIEAASTLDLTALNQLQQKIAAAAYALQEVTEALDIGARHAEEAAGEEGQASEQQRKDEEGGGG